MEPRKLMLGIAGIAALAILSSIACGDDDDVATTPTAPAATAQPTVAPRPLKDVLKDAINEEYKARASYQAVLDKFGQVAPFINIRNAENTHVDAWKRLYEVNKLDVPPDIFAGRMVAAADLKKACAEAIDAEKTDIALYDQLMKQTTDAETLKVLAEQRKASAENHLPAFEQCAQ